MRNKSILFILLTVCFLTPIFGGEIPIDFQKGNPIGGSRSENEDIVTASIIDCDLITISFSEYTSSQVFIYNELDSRAPIYYQNYSFADSCYINTTSLNPGFYILEIFVFNSWWTGHFVIE
ncbi:MAG: hypothetical protein MJY66_00360 [Bacteroidaceae bacterium]|nr:hypothetical protein [Bacteroidaceae bacterium]